MDGGGDKVVRRRRRRERQSTILSHGFQNREDSNLEDEDVEDYDNFAERLVNKEDNAVGLTDQEKRMLLLGKWKECLRISPVWFAVLVVLLGMGLFNKMTAEEKVVAVPEPVKVQGDSFNFVWRGWREALDKHKTALTVDEIQHVEGGPMYLVIGGHVFDVTSGEKMYGKGSDYHGFIGRDGTRAFVTGEFNEEGLTPDVRGLKDGDVKGIASWIDFYWTHKQYRFKGVLRGHFFNENGKPTENMGQFLVDLAKAEAGEQAEKIVKEQFPPCNSEWTAETGSKLSCSEMSGGIQRDWAGVPRQFKDADEQIRCACVHPKDLGDPRVSEYENCRADSGVCQIA